MLWDVFISHASEDKEEVARPLATLLQDKGLRVWLDEQQIVLGDSLSQSIGDALVFSRFGALILSPTFFDKDYPQQEKQALLARQRARGRFILPILHKIDRDTLLDREPLLADYLSVSTGEGLSRVADEIHRAVVGLPRDQTTTDAIRYFEQFDFPQDLTTAALEAIEALCKAATWSHLTPVRDMKDKDVWMGSDAEALIQLLFKLYAPIVHFFNHRYSVERTLTTLHPVGRARFVLLDAALEALTRDGLIAAAAPSLAYTPRRPSWRQKRAVEPGKYWWQGLPRERIKDAAPTFYQSPARSELPSYASFRRAYGVGYRAFGGGQQTLGLLANPLYGFEPRTRPVYWRMLSIWHCLYASVQALPGEATSTQLRRMFVDTPWTQATLPSHDLGEDLLPESPEQTREAVTNYCRTYIEPMLRDVLQSD
jgi:TIR domain